MIMVEMKFSTFRVYKKCFVMMVKFVAAGRADWLKYCQAGSKQLQTVNMVAQKPALDC